MTLPGETDLRAWLGEPRATREIIDIFARAAAGLAAAHRRGLRHSDLRTETIFVSSDRRVRFADNWAAHANGAPEEDVLALCMLLDRALAGVTNVPAELRLAIARGLERDRVRRGQLAELLAALQPRRRARRSLLGGAAALAAIAGGVGVGALAAMSRGDQPPPSCERAPTWLDPARRGQLVAIANHEAMSFIDSLDERARHLDERFAEVCRAEQAGRLAPYAAQVRRSCLRRRVFEYDATVTGIVANRNRAAMLDRIAQLDGGEPCSEIDAAPLFADSRSARALWGRFVAADELATPGTTEQQAQALAAIEQEAASSAEHELAVRAALSLTRLYEQQDRLGDADAALDRAYRVAVDIKATTYSALALLARSRVAAKRNDGAAAHNFAQLAQDAATSSVMTPMWQAQLAGAFAAAAAVSGDYKAAVQQYQTGIDMLVAQGTKARHVELDLRNRQSEALVRSKGEARRAVETSKQATARAKALVGERDLAYAIALDTHSVALRAAGDVKAALATRKQALDVFSSLLPADDATVVQKHIDYAGELLAVRRLRDAINHYEHARKHGERNERLRANQWEIHFGLAVAKSELGHHREALVHARTAVDLVVASYGDEDPHTVQAAHQLLELALELDKYDEVERAIAMLDRAWRGEAADDALRKLQLDGAYRAELAIRRGNAQAGEARARKALAALVARKASADHIWPVQRVVGEALLARRKFAAARTAFEAALKTVKAARPREDRVAVVELGIARADAGQGKRARAKQRARAIRAVLAKYPGQLIGNRIATQLAR